MHETPGPAFSNATRAMVVIISWPLLFTLLLMPSRLQPSFCPSDTLVSGHLIGLEVVLGAMLAGVGPLMAGLGFAQHNIKFTPTRQQRFRIVGRVGWVFTALVLPVWLDGLFTYYCASSDTIAVHPDPLKSPIIYTWKDVSGVQTRCAYGRGGMSVVFDLRMSDGRTIGLGGDSWSSLLQNYDHISAALHSVPYHYDNEASRCPSYLRQVFAYKPGLGTIAQADDEGQYSTAAAVSAYNRGDFGTAFAILRRRADRADSDAEVNLGYLYARGQAVAPEQFRAFKLYGLSARKGNGEGMNALGYKYEFGAGIKRDIDKAIYWYCAAIRAGNPRAMNNLALMLSNGKEVPRDLAAASDLWQQAADRGDANGPYNLGLWLLQSPPNSEDHERGERLIVEAANRGQGSAQTILRRSGYAGSLPPVVDFGGQMKLQPPDAAPGHADICSTTASAKRTSASISPE